MRSSQLVPDRGGTTDGEECSRCHPSNREQPVEERPHDGTGHEGERQDLDEHDEGAEDVADHGASQSMSVARMSSGAWNTASASSSVQPAAAAEAHSST